MYMEDHVQSMSAVCGQHNNPLIVYNLHAVGHASHAAMGEAMAA